MRPIREKVDQVIDTTVGRVIFNERLTRDGLPFINGVLKKKGLQSLVTFCHLKLGHERRSCMLDDLKAMGFLYATKAGHLDRHRRHGHAAVEEGHHREGARRRSRNFASSTRKRR